MKFNNISFALLIVVLTIGDAYASFFRTLTYDEVRKEGGFKSFSLKNVATIVPAGICLSQDEKKDIVESDSFISLKTISFREQNIDDSFIENICKNNSLRRIINLDLSKNGSITGTSLQYILNSSILGSIRDLLQISGRYNVPSSTIYVEAKDTGINNSENILYKENFIIHYFHSVFGNKTEASSEGVKVVEVTLF